MRSSKRSPLWAIGALVALILGFTIFDGDGDTSRDASAPSITKVLAAHQVDELGATLGSQTAPVTLIDFIDLECGPAATFHREVMPTIISRYVKTGKVKVMLVDVGDQNTKSLKAQAIFARMATKNLAWEWTNQMFKTKKGPHNSRSMSHAYTEHLIKKIPGASMDDAGLPDATTNAALTRADNLAYDLGVDGTPELAAGPSNVDWSQYHLIAGNNPVDILAAINQQLDDV